MIHADQIGRTVGAYLRRYPGEAGRLTALSEALVRPGDLTSRRRFSGHVTCSAIVVDEAQRTLHIRHNALDMWLLPGGHMEDTDVSLIGAAQREAVEETGISADRLTLADEVPIDIDVHPIPANPVKDEPEHQHFDIRYIFVLTGDATVSLQAEEVHDFAWVPVGELQPRELWDKVSKVMPLDLIV